MQPGDESCRQFPGVLPCLPRGHHRRVRRQVAMPLLARRFERHGGCRIDADIAERGNHPLPEILFHDALTLFLAAGRAVERFGFVVRGFRTGASSLTRTAFASPQSFSRL